MNLPLGFRYAATYAGIRQQSSGQQPSDDVALIAADPPAQAAAVFTTNLVQAAPVRLSRRHLRSSRGKVSAILVNAGNANCATRTGDRVAALSCKAVAKALGTRRQYVLPASTGVIGVELDPKLLTAAVPKLVSTLSSYSFEVAAQAMLTTDTRLKVAAEPVMLGNSEVRIAGMTKGSGMIHPNMATTLGFVMTDAVIEAKYLREILATAVRNSYNSLTVDGDMSTNDTVVLLASGASRVRPDRRQRQTVGEAIARVMENLARQIAMDGEGARKLITVQASGFKTEEDARKVAGAVANSPLVKTAVAGSDPNWGRILSAAGYSGAQFDPSRIDIYLQGQLVCRGGLAGKYYETELIHKLGYSEVRIEVVLRGGGKGKSSFFTCDLTENYIRINGSYRT